MSASRRGTLGLASDLDMYCAAATAACNLEYVYHGHTVREYLTGEVPRTHYDMVTPADVPDILGVLDEPFLEQLRSLLIEQNTLLEVLHDDDARYSAMSSYAASSRRHITQFTLFPGDRVSYKGQVYKLMPSIDTSTPSESAKALIRLVSHESAPTRIVRYSSLRPLASPRPEHMHSTVATGSMQVGKFVFFSSDTMSSADVLGGKIVSVDTDTECITVHEHHQDSHTSGYTLIHQHCTL